MEDLVMTVQGGKVDESTLENGDPAAAAAAAAGPPALRPKKMFQRFLAEFLGTFILVAFGCGSVAQFELTKNVNETTGKFYDVQDERGTFLSLNICWALGVAFGCYAAGSVSEAHLNPAVTLALASLRRFPLADVPIYWLAQTAGGFFGAVLVYGVYIDAINNFDGGSRQVYDVKETVSIFATYPEPYLTVGGAFLDQLVGTMFLVLCIFSINDDMNINVPPFMKPILVGGAVLAVGTGFGLNTGFAINPARDFGPRLFSAMPYGIGVWQRGHNFWWIPIIGPLIGGVIGAWIYHLAIERWLRM